MKAILMEQAGSPEQLKLAEMAQPSIQQSDQLLIKIRAAGVNSIDTKLRANGTYYPDNMPAVLGCDGSGVVIETGSQVTRFKPGDEVYYFFGGIGGDEQGNYAEYNLIGEQYVALKPDSISFEEAAAAPLVLITAWEALHHRAKIQAGQTILIHAGAGGVGHVAIQLAKAANCRVLTTVSSDTKEALARSLGADEVIRYDLSDFAQQTMALTDGAGVDVVFDTVGGATFESSFNALKPYGHLVTLLQPSHSVDWKVARLKNITTSLELMLSPAFYNWQQARLEQTKILDRCSRLFNSGQLRVIVNHKLPLESAADTHRLIENGSMEGKAVLIPQF
ncbi:MAG: zinc-dependent alcohol dehydrogenase family protein [Gammaproteobacteria bacterium]|nr:zinc-dependent alcohol dehydrogenase family protein [Gammaproteobacteria bacterium]